VKPALLRWARDHAGLQLEQLARCFPRLSDWESGNVCPTRKQLERFAKATHAPLEHLLRSAPPVLLPGERVRQQSNCLLK
jgi:transcriptional regulator with XRE-family HTH domain